MSAIVEPTTFSDARRLCRGSQDRFGQPPRVPRCPGAPYLPGAAAAALSLILLLLGTGLGLSSVSPWSNEGIDAGTFGVSSILWITFMQLAASPWAAISPAAADEVARRAYGRGLLPRYGPRLVAWAVATLGTAALLTSVIGSILGGGVQAGAAALGGRQRPPSAARSRARKAKQATPAKPMARWRTTSIRCSASTPTHAGAMTRRSKAQRPPPKPLASSSMACARVRCPTTTRVRRGRGRGSHRSDTAAGRAACSRRVHRPCRRR